jgi:4'-phosphopantetheinyl transferase
MLEIPPCEIHLWLVACDEIRDPRLLTEYRALLSADELQRLERFRFSEHQHQFLITRATVRTVLSHYANVQPALWRFDSNERGRPSIHRGDACAQPISFNTSHTDGLVLVGIARRSLIGVDAENITSCHFSLELADQVFSREEAAALHALPADRQTERFLQYWTLKESYLKACGAGLSIPLDLFGFCFPGVGRIRVDFQPQLNDDPARWCFWLLRPAGPYVVAVCAERAAERTQELVVRKAVPLQSAETIECIVSHASA